MTTADSNPDDHHQTLQTGNHRHLVSNNTICYCMRAPSKLAYADADGCLIFVEECCNTSDSHMTQPSSAVLQRR